MDKALKQRLVGASVLIALAVIVLPMLLSGRPESASQYTQKIELPPRPDELTFETRRFPVTDGQGASQTDESQQAEIPMPDVEPDQAAGSKVSIAPKPQDPAAASDAASQQAASDAPLPDMAPQNATPDGSVSPGDGSGVSTAEAGDQQPAGRYLVQVASLSSSENASRLAVSLQEKGFPVLIDTVESDVGRLNRVRVGPFAGEAEAVQASGRIGKEIAGVNPRVVDQMPDSSETAEIAADSLMRWVVQVGSFSDSTNAERLVEQLRTEGMNAYQETVTSSSTSIFRVRVGPFLEREEAIRIRQLLSERLSINGVVMGAD